MAGLICSTQCSEVALLASDAKTVLKLTAPANHRIRLKRWAIFFDGVVGTAVPIQVILCRVSGGSFTAGTVVRQSAGSESPQCSGAYDASVEPAVTDILDMAMVHPQSGYEVVLPFDMPVEVPGGGEIGIVVTADDAVNARAKFVFEE